MSPPAPPPRLSKYRSKMGSGANGTSIGDPRAPEVQMLCRGVCSFVRWERASSCVEGAGAERNQEETRVVSRI